MQNSYIYKSHLSEITFLEVLKCFVDDKNACECAKITGINRNTTTRLYHLFRGRIADIQRNSFKLPEKIDPEIVNFGILGLVTHNCFRESGENVRIAILNKEGTIFASVVSDKSVLKMASVLDERINEAKEDIKAEKEIIQILLELSEKFNLQVNLGEKKSIEIANDEDRLFEIDEFLEFSKTRLKKFYGVKPDEFKIHLAECCFRWNNRHFDLFNILKEEFRENPLH